MLAGRYDQGGLSRNDRFLSKQVDAPLRDGSLKGP